MKSKVVSLTLTGLILPIAFIWPEIAPAKKTATRTNVAIAQPGCEPSRARDLKELLPCAWTAAQREVEQRYPNLGPQISELRRPEVAFRQGPWFDNELGDYVDGDTDLDDDPPITLGLTGDIEYDYHTAIHEYKHAIVDLMRLGEDAHRWVDSDDDPPDTQN